MHTEIGNIPRNYSLPLNMNHFLFSETNTIEVPTTDFQMMCFGYDWIHGDKVFWIKNGSQTISVRMDSLDTIIETLKKLNSSCGEYPHF